VTAPVLAALVGLRFEVAHDDGTLDTGLVTGAASWSEEYVLVQTSRGQTCRRFDHLLHHLDPVPPTERRHTVAATEKPRKESTPKSKLAKAMDGDDQKLAKFLLANPTYSDATWASRAGGKTRRKDESRESFIQRVLLG
jgi:hypothetical protein